MSEARAQGNKPNFFIVGAHKCGTTAWFEYLRSHPDIYMSDLKEPCFFAFDYPKFRRIDSETGYLRLFAESGSRKVIGEASAVYLFSEVAAEAIRRFSPDARILILLRDQEDYLPSVHNQNLHEFAENIRDFGRAWSLSGHRPPSTIPPECVDARVLDYAMMGRFREQVERYLDEFPAEQILVLRFDDWVADPRSSYLRVLAFLGVPDDGRNNFPRVYPGMTYRSRRVARLVASPPSGLRRVVALVKRITGLQSATLLAAGQKTLKFLSRRGYKKEISSELREEIRRYYADDNRLLDERLRQMRGPSGADRRRAAVSDVRAGK